MKTHCGASPAQRGGHPHHLRALASNCARTIRLRTGVVAFPRPDGTVQMGCSELRALRLRPPAPLDQASCLMLLSLLRAGQTAEQLRSMAAPRAVDELLRLLRAAGLLARRETRPARVHVHGSGPISTGLRSALEEGGACVTATRDTLLRRDIPEHLPELVVLADRVAPDPAIIHQLLVARTPHIQVRLVDGDGHIGPLVLPGRTGCLWCVQHRAAQADPTRSELLRRLGSCPGHAEPRVLRDVLAQAGAEIAHTLQLLRRANPLPGAPAVPPPRVLGAVVEVGHDGVLSPPRPEPAHPACLFQKILPHREAPAETAQGPLARRFPPLLPAASCMIGH